MNRFCIFILLICSLSAAEMTFEMTKIDHELPDLGVNQDKITCDNLVAATKAIKEDQARLNYIISNDIPKALEEIENLETYFTDACNLEDEDQFDLKIQNRPIRDQMGDIIPNSPEINRIIVERLDKIEHYIQTKPSVKALYDACNKVENAYDDLQCYLEWAQDEIQSVWVHDFFEKRSSTLKKVHYNCDEESKKCKQREAEMPSPTDNKKTEEKIETTIDEEKTEPTDDPQDEIKRQKDEEDKKRAEEEDKKKAEEEEKKRAEEEDKKKAEEERQAELARQKEAEEKRQAESDRQAELNRQKEQAEREAEIARQKAEEERQAELARQKAEEQRQAELEKERAEAERQAELARQKEEEEKQAELERQRLEAERQAEIARQKAEEEKQAEIARQKAEAERQAELERQRVEAERQAELARQKEEEERKAELERQRVEAERQAEIARKKAEEEKQAEIARQKAEEEKQAEIARQKAEADRQAEIARKQAEAERQAELDRQKAEADRQAEIARNKAEDERRQAIIDSRGIRTPITLDSLPSDNFPVDATKSIATGATSKDDISRDNDVLFVISLNRTETSLSPCVIAQYGIYDNDFQSPTTAVFQNSYFEASSTSFGFSVSDGSGGQRQFTIGTVTGTNKRIETGGKPVKLIEKAAKSLTITFVDDTTKTVAIDTVKSVTASEFDIILNGFPAVGHRSCLKKLSGDKQQVQIVQLITSKSHVILDGTNF